MDIMDSKQRLHVMTLANSIIGVSILAMPFCFKQCGIVLSIVLLIFSSILCRLACHFLLKSAVKSRLRTFEFLAYHVFGSLGKLFVEFGMIGFLLGTCVAFFVVMGDLGPQIIAQMTETKSMETLRTTILIALGFLCVLPLGLLRNVDSLSSVCIATIGFYGILVLKIFSESAPHLLAGDWYENVDLWRPAGILQCIPIFSMALFCQTQLFEIYQAIPNASLEKMNEVVKIAVNICTSIYIFVGVFGYIAVSHKPIFSGNILMDFQPSMFTEIIKLGFVLSVAFSFPLIIFPCRASLYSLIYRPTYTGLHDSNSLYIPEGKFRILTLIIIIISLTIGVLIPNIELVLGLVGSTIGIMICVIFPATCFICLTDKNTNERILAQLMLIIGITVMVLGTYANLYAIDNVSTNQIAHLDKLSSDGLSLNINIKEKPLVTPKLLETIQNLGALSKEIKIPDSVKEVRHEPPQPEAPQENQEHKANADKLIEPKEVVNNQDETNKLEKSEEEIHKQDVPLEIEPQLDNNEKKIPEEVKVLQNPIDSNALPETIDRKDDRVLEVDLEAIKKEDEELEKANAPASKEYSVEHKKLIEEKEIFAQESKKMLQDIKIAQQEQQKQLEKVNVAVKNIQQIAQEAIKIISDDKIKDTEVRPRVQKFANDEIKSIVVDAQNLVNANENKKLESVYLNPVQPNLKSPLSYQLGLQNKNHTVNITNTVQIPNESEINDAKHVESISENVSNKPMNSVGIDTLIKLLPDRKEFKTIADLKQVLDVEILKQKVQNETIAKQKTLNEKKHENAQMRRDILSHDYGRQKREAESQNCENDEKNEENNKVFETKNDFKK